MANLNLALAAAFVISATAQAPYLDHWLELQSRQPASVSLQISAPKTQFYSGELIPLQLSFTSTQSQAYVADSLINDRIGRMNGIEEFLIDPAALTEDPLQGLTGHGGSMGGLSGGPMPLSNKPFSFERLLNDWVRFRAPGTYRIAILSHRVKEVSGANVELVSNILTLKIVPAPAKWVQDQISESAQLLNSGTNEQRLQAARTLRHLGTLQSATELAKHLGDGNAIDPWTVKITLLESPYRAQLLPMIEARLTAPDQPVTSDYLDALGPATRNEYIARLIASLPAKQPEARAISVNTLLNSGTDPTSLAPISALLIGDFPKLSPALQINLLENHWTLIRNSAILPILRELDADPAQQDIATRRIYDLAPEEGRGIILTQLRQPNKSLSVATLTMLPDEHLPELNDLLASRGNDTLILRYATGDIVERVEHAYQARNKELDRQKLPHCGGPLVYYFLKEDPPYGEKELRKEMEDPAPYPGCYDMASQFRNLGRYAYSPALEKLAIEFLASPKVPVKRGAAELLGKYGSPAAQQPLWETLEYFHSYWKGREKQLEEPEGREGIQFERALRIALGQADAWKLQPSELNRLLSLCTSKWCSQDVKDWMSQSAMLKSRSGASAGSSDFRN